MSAFEEQELKKLADSLAGLVPRPAHLDRDGLLYEAGRRSARAAGFWPWLALGLAMVVVFLAVVLIIRSERVEIQYVHIRDEPVPVLPPPMAAQQMPADSSTQHLERLSTGLHNYQAAHKAFPAYANFDKDKKPMLSWRVHILPYVEQDELYRQFKLDEPWDSEHNLKLVPQMPAVYKSPVSKTMVSGKTVYLGTAGNEMIFANPDGTSLSKIGERASNTILVVEANDACAVTWTQPEDYKPERKDPLAPLRRMDGNSMHALFADGTVRVLSRDLEPEAMWGLLTVSGGDGN